MNGGDGQCRCIQEPMSSRPSDVKLSVRTAPWNVVAEWLGCRTLKQRVVGSNPDEGTAWYL
jgi:hypothetical protein